MWEVSDEAGVALARYSNPPMNYFTDEAIDELLGLAASWREPDVSAVVLTGVPGRFITHFSAERLLEGQRNREALIAGGPERNHRVHSLMRDLSALPKPVIAALGGDAMGFGFELALACDIRIAERGDYRYGLPEVRLGILPGGSGTQRLARLIGTGRAIDLILRARILTPEEALQAGLVHELEDDALAAAVALAKRMATLPPVAIAMAKRVLYQGSDLPLEVATAMEAEAAFRAKLAPGAEVALAEYVALPFEQRRDWLDAERLSRDAEPPAAPRRPE